MKLGFGVVLLLLLNACSGAGYETPPGALANSLTISGSVDAVNLLLSKRECSAALAKITPLYSSINSNNAIRFATASSYACSARVDFLSTLDAIVDYQSTTPLGILFELSAKQFPSTANPDDKVPQAAANATDALHAIIHPGTILIDAYTVNSKTDNPGSLLVGDRLSDANSYLTMVSMALIGSLENRYAAPDANNSYHKSNDLPWTTAASTVGDGCAYASAILNFFDGLSYIESVASPTIARAYKAFETLAPQIGYGCCVGLQTCGFAVDCGLSVPCSATGTCTTCTNCADCPSLCQSCPTALRGRTSCTGEAMDRNSCAAAGMVEQVNNALWSGP